MSKSNPSVGLLTIGQSLRSDLIPEFSKLLHPHIKVFKAGALDELTADKIADLAPSAENPSLITRLKDGKAVIVDKEKITPILQQKIDYLQKQQVNLIALLCTESFNIFSSKSFLLQPENFLSALVKALVTQGSIGIFTPLKEQIKSVKLRWEKIGIETYVESASPYGNLQALKDAAVRLSSHKNIKIILMNCIGYSLKMKQMITPFFQIPVILPRSLLARAINELMD